MSDGGDVSLRTGARSAESFSYIPRTSNNNIVWRAFFLLDCESRDTID